MFLDCICQILTHVYKCASLWVWVSVCVPYLKGTCWHTFHRPKFGGCHPMCYFSVGDIGTWALFIISLNFHFSRSLALQQLFWTYQILNCTGYSAEYWNNLSCNLHFTNWFAVSRHRNVSLVYNPFSGFAIPNGSYLPY